MNVTSETITAGAAIKKRVGTDLFLTFALKENGVDAPLSERENIAVYIQRNTIYKSPKKIENFTVQGSNISIQYNALDNNTVGVFNVSIEYDMTSAASETDAVHLVSDIVNAFEIVPFSVEETTIDDNIIINANTVMFGVDGLDSFETWKKYTNQPNATFNDYIIAMKVPYSNIVQTTGTSTTDIMSQKATTDELNTKALKVTQINAGAGLTGGGTLGQDRTLDIVSANDGITVNADNIQLNTQDVLNSTSTTKPLSAKQGAELNNRINMYGTAGGTAQAITLTVSALITLSAGMRFTFKPIANNTATSPTININNLGAKTILRGINAAAAAALIANDIVQNIDAILEYDGTNFRLLNPQTGGIVQTTGTDTDKVMSQKAVTDAIANSMWYGIEWDTTISTPTCTRIGNIELHKSLPIQNKMKRCLLNDAGVVVKYVDETTNVSELDGSLGQVMVELPMHYIKFETEGTKRRVKISEWAISDFTQIKKQYVSAYEATVERATNKLASVVNTTAAYRGGNNTSTWDSLSRTLLGKPATNLSLTTFRTNARNRGSVNWNCNTYQIHRELFWLFAIEYATLNSQSPYNAALTTEGYKQGGLGDGITTLDGTKWNNFNGSNPFVSCGYTNSLGNKTGVVSFTMPFEYDSNGSANYIGEHNVATSYVVGNYVSSGTSLYVCILASTGNAVTNTTYFTPVTRKTVSVLSYRGVENPFGHLWKWTDGCKCMIQSDASGGISEFYVCDTPANFTSSGTTNYQLRGNLPRTNGYVKEVILGEYGEIMPLSVGGGSTTYFCDNFYTSKPASGIDERGVLFGGDAPAGAYAGFVYASASSTASSAGANIGSRLCFIP